MKSKPPLKIESLEFCHEAYGPYSVMQDQDGNLYLVGAIDTEEDAKQPCKTSKASEVKHVMTWGDPSKTGPGGNHGS